MQFVLVGPNQGKSIRLAGAKFVHGVAEVPDDAKDFHNLLSNFHSAHPAHQITKSEDGVLSVVPAGEEVRLNFTPTPLAKPDPKTASQSVPVDLNSLTKPDLIAKAEALGVPTEGTKADLIARIQAVSE